MALSHAGPVALIASLAILGTLAVGMIARPSLPDAVGSCRPDFLPVSLATTSKIDPTDPHKATLGAAASNREATLRPVRRAIGSVAAAAEGDARERHCAARTIAAWARSNALGDMRGKDANLTRGRLGAEVLLAAVHLDERSAFARSDREAVAAWASGLAVSTIAFFAERAGSESRINNHRQWAGLLVGAASRLTGEATYLEWARQSAEIALCHVMSEGFLPAELKRGRLAWRYHRYALRPVRALHALGAWDGVIDPCSKGLERLGAIAADPTTIERATGIVQDGPVSETSFGPTLRLDPITTDRGA